MTLFKIIQRQFHQVFPKNQNESDKSNILKPRNKNQKLKKENDLIQATSPLLYTLDQKQVTKKI